LKVEKDLRLSVRKLLLILEMIKQLFSSRLPFWLVTLASCSPAAYKNYISNYAAAAKPNVDAPDYSNLYYWAAHPYKKDPSDSVPAPLQANYSLDSSVDVFFLHPTSFTDKNNVLTNADINNDTLNAKTDYSSILYQASAFNEYRVFAPRYRQAHLRNYYTTDTAAAKKAFDLAYQDVKAAFEFYLAHYHQGRPIIIASHSQGSTHAQHLLKDFFENKPLQSKLVLAYVIGMYIPNTYFSALKMCATPFETGCLCGWRTFKKDYIAPYVIKEKGSGWVTNPLSGRTDTLYADFSLNKGAVLKNFNVIKPGVANAQISKTNGVLWIDRPRISGAFLLKIKNFHVGDINLFYLNIREDVKRRVGLFWTKKEK
jgi:hypothetical protein